MGMQKFEYSCKIPSNSKLSCSRERYNRLITGANDP